MSGISEVRSDIQAFKAIVQSGAAVPDWAVNAIWRWFFDQELRVPLPIMPMSENERRDLASAILDEMETHFVALEKISNEGGEDEGQDLNSTEDGQRVNQLWRELAGCYAHLLNRSVTVLSEEEAEIAYVSIIPALIATSGASEEEIVERIRYDGSTRMFLRRSGIDPDRLLGG